MLLDDGGKYLGELEPLDSAAGGGLSKPAQVMSYCTRFNGSFKDTDGQVRGTESSAAVMTLLVPVSAGDVGMCRHHCGSASDNTLARQ